MNDRGDVTSSRPTFTDMSDNRRLPRCSRLVTVHCRRCAGEKRNRGKEEHERDRCTLSKAFDARRAVYTVKILKLTETRCVFRDKHFALTHFGSRFVSVPCQRGTSTRCPAIRSRSGMFLFVLVVRREAFVNGFVIRFRDSRRHAPGKKSRVSPRHF